MSLPSTSAVVAAVLLGASAAGAHGSVAAAQETDPASGPEVRIRIDGEDEPVVRRGERIRVEYQVSPGAHVAVFQIDTDGTVRLVHPRDPWDESWVRGARSHRLLFSDSPFWFVDDSPGMGYFFVVASPEPFDFSSFRYASGSRSWDLGLVGRHVYRDPYVAMDDYVAAILPEWERIPYGLDFTAYHVEERQRFPRFLCYDCHGFRPYRAWNPYRAACTSFRVVVYSDPYYYPARRYRGDRVVFVRPPVTGQPRFAFKERARGEPSNPLIVEHTPGRERPRIPGLRPPVRRGGTAARPGSAGGRVPADPAGLGPTPRRGGEAGSARPPTADRPASAAPRTGPRGPGAGEAGPAPRGRPSSVLPGRRPLPTRPRGAERPRLERRTRPDGEEGPQARPSPPERGSPARPAPPTRPSRNPAPSRGRGEARPAPPERERPRAEPRRSPPSQRARPRPSPPPQRSRPQRSPPPERARPQRSPPPERARPQRSPPPQRSRPQRSPPAERARPQRSPPPQRSRPQRSPPAPRARPQRSPPPPSPRRRPPPAPGLAF